ncbi:MAG TPA: acyltransferase [Gemmatimonadaceae bacterium]|nr:acyltransferase [Gemmatimonadaceae bacterium]
MITLRTHIPGDWYPVGMPANIELGKDVYIDSSYGFAGFDSEQEPGLVMGDACGAYDRAALIVGRRGVVTVGAFTVLNGTYVICDERIDIGAHCLLSWGVVITDNWFGAGASTLERRDALIASSRDQLRHAPAVGTPRPVAIEDNVWIGFDAVIMPGVKLGRGCVVGSRSIVAEDVPPYAIVVGDPARIIRYLEPDDTAAARADAMNQLLR